MARYTGPMTKKSRRLGVDLVGGDKAFEQRPYPPGVHGRGRTKESEYSLQLREKQKARFSYGVLEKQFRRYYEEANRMQGKTGDNLLADPGVPARQRGLPRRARPYPSAGPPVRRARPLPGQRPEGRTSRRTGSAPTTSSISPRRSREQTPHIINRETHGERDVPAWMQVLPDRGRILIHQLPTREQIVDRRPGATDRRALLQVEL